MIHTTLSFPAISHRGNRGNRGRGGGGVKRELTDLISSGEYTVLHKS